MPFEELKTDEKLDQPVKPERDLDTQMLFGCSAFVGVALFSYALSVWPFFVFPELHRMNTLLLSSAAGLIPALIVGVVACRRFSLAGASGFVGGAMATGIFLFLRLGQMDIARSNRDLPQPEFPAAFNWALPLAWLLLAVVASILALPKKALM